MLMQQAPRRYSPLVLERQRSPPKNWKLRGRPGNRQKANPDNLPKAGNRRRSLLSLLKARVRTILLRLPVMI